jgi:hypothetical protein
MQISTSEIRFLYCNQCKSETKHFCHCSHTRRREYIAGNLVENPTNNPIGNWDEYDETINKMWICAGCEQASLEIRYTNSSMFEQDGTQIYEVNLFPVRAESHIAKKRFSQLPLRLKSIYHEVLLAYNNQMYLSCAVGIRTLIEGICADKEITGKNLVAKINGLEQILPKTIVVHLHSLRFMGNEATHDLSAPTQDELRLAIEICEDLLNYLYELDEKVSHLASIRQNRKMNL